VKVSPERMFCGSKIGHYEEMGKKSYVCATELYIRIHEMIFPQNALLCHL